MIHLKVGGVLVADYDPLELEGSEVSVSKKVLTNLLEGWKLSPRQCANGTV
jgi:hypothetical protein